MTCHASGILLYRRGGDVPRLLLLRSSDTGGWGFAKGRREEGDAHEVATALREVREETGYAELALHPRFRAELSYLVRDPDGPYPKRVVYFLAEAPPAEPHLSHEHDAARWADEVETVSLLAFDQLRDLARAAFAALDGVPGSTPRGVPDAS